ncbi:hypothetical protein ACJJIW_02165 [Microbulbifer sp. JMSA004]|uniref:hypothetical protein n=1 Tax=Microbulbifer sp. JMSA004 TaxID=3243370 RepID=UPI004039DFD0
MQEELIFIGNQVSCRYVSVSDGGTPLAITFQQRLPENVDKSINQLGFAQRFLEKIKINAFHVLIHENHWYQTGEIFECIEAIKKRSEYNLATRRILYGSSMGAYASLLFMKQFRLNSVIAISPLFSIDRKKVPDEKRWGKDLVGLEFLYDEIPQSISIYTDVYIIYDPYSADRLHVDLLNISGATLLRLPFSGHPSSIYLSETGMLSYLVKNIMNGHLGPSDVGYLIRLAFRKRRSARSFYINLFRLVYAKRKMIMSDYILSLGRINFPGDPFFKKIQK